MRTSVLAMLVVFGSAMAFPATAQQKPGPQQAAPSQNQNQTMQRNTDEQLKGSGPDQQMQRDADKGAKTRNSGNSGYVADQDKPGASSHPPGQPKTGQTTGTGSAKAHSKSHY